MKGEGVGFEERDPGREGHVFGEGHQDPCGAEREQRVPPRLLYRGTSLIRNSTPLGPYRRTMSRV